MALRIIIILALLLLSAFFSCSETALFSLSRSEVARFKNSKNWFYKNVLDALANPRQLLVSILLGNELVNVAIAILIAAITYELLPKMDWQPKILISVAVSTPLIVVIGEVIPKNIGIRFASSLSLVCAVFIRAFSYLLSPVRNLLLKLADRAIIFFHGKPENIRSMIMEEEFRQLVEMGRDEGSLGEAEGELIHRVFDMADKTVEEIMTPKEAIFSVALGDDITAVLSQVRTNQFSRIPVYDSGHDDIVGILHVRDLFSVMRRRRINKVHDVENIIRPAFFAPLNTTLEEILREFQKLKAHMAIITDNQRRPIGVVTMDDVFATLFGDVF